LRSPRCATTVLAGARRFRDDHDRLELHDRDALRGDDHRRQLVTRASF